MLAQIAERVAGEQRSGRGRHEHLSAVTGGCDARRAVDVDADVALLGQVRRAGVDAHADPDRPGGERLLGRCRRAQRTGRGGKGDEEGIPLRVDLDAAVDAERGAQDAAVLRERLGVGFGEIGRASCRERV